MLPLSPAQFLCQWDNPIKPRPRCHGTTTLPGSPAPVAMASRRYHQVPPPLPWHRDALAGPSWRPRGRRRGRTRRWCLCTAGWTRCRCRGRAGTSPATSAMGVGLAGTRRGGRGGRCPRRCHPQRVPAVPAVLAAEVVKFFFPSMVELHSFVPTSSTAQKVANWGHLNR